MFLIFVVFFLLNSEVMLSSFSTTFAILLLGGDKAPKLRCVPRIVRIRFMYLFVTCSPGEEGRAAACLCK